MNSSSNSSSTGPSSTGPVDKNRCPLCGGEVKVETDQIFGEIDCPQCGKHLWFLSAAFAARFFDFESSTELREQAIGMMAERLELDPSDLANNPKLIQEIETDSLEALELIMDLEEQLGLV